MASIIRDPGGRKRIGFNASDGSRRTIRLGRVDLRYAEVVRVKVEAILSAAITGALDAPTSKWLASLDDRMHAKFAKAGLVPPRESANPTLNMLMNAYFETVNVKPGTVTTYEQTRRSLEDYFGKDRSLTAINALDGDRWRRSMVDEKLAEATISKRVKTARQIFKRGVKWKMLTENPLIDVRAGSQTNKDRMFFVSRADSQRVLDACPNAEWRLIFALSRYGGLRCPSEHLGLRWQDVDWAKERVTVWSPKTEGHEGREFRIVPLFPELRPYLLEVFEQAVPGTEFVITRYHDRNSNLRTQLLRIMARAGVKAWPRLFHNLRSTRQTELAETYPIHVVCSWLGNTPAIAAGHYLQVHEGHFEAAVATKEKASPEKATQNPTQQAAEIGRSEPQSNSAEPQKAAVFPLVAAPCGSLQHQQVTPTGFEPVSRP